MIIVNNNKELEEPTIISKLRKAAVALCLSLACTAMQGADSTAIYNRLFLEAMVERQKGNDSAVFELLRRCADLNPHASETQF